MDEHETNSSGSWIFLGLMICAWILYELYGRIFFEWMAQWTTYIRIAGGILAICYMWWYVRETPEGFQNTVDLTKQLLLTPSTTTKEKRNVTGLMKKKVAASQKWQCGHCKALLEETFEVDHIQALYKGGTNDESNLVALCPNCHRKKTVDERLH
jgi:hypothetical protein